MVENVERDASCVKRDEYSSYAIRNTQYAIRTRWRELELHHYIKIAIIAALLYFLFRNEIGSIVNRWLTDPTWSHGLLIPFFSLFFLNQKRKAILNIKSKPNYLGLLFLIMAILFYFFNIVSPSGYAYFRRISIIAALGAVVLFLGGWCLVKHTWLPIIFLIFAVPLPQRYYVSLTMPMRQLAATIATALLNLISGIEANVNGVVIDVIYKGQRVEPALNVADACSGMRLLMAFVALGIIMAYLHYRPIWQRIILLASTIPIAIFCNIVRVTATAFIHILIDPKYAQGPWHDVLGYATLLLAFGLYSFLAWFMASLFIEDTSINAEDIIIHKSNI
jgi:exosortase